MARNREPLTRTNALVRGLFERNFWIRPRGAQRAIPETPASGGDPPRGPPPRARPQDATGGGPASGGSQQYRLGSPLLSPGGSESGSPQPVWPGGQTALGPQPASSGFPDPASRDGRVAQDVSGSPALSGVVPSGAASSGAPLAHPPGGGGASRVLLVVPEGPPPVAEGRVRVEVLGSPRVSGWPEGVAPPGQSVLELLAFLALHPGRRFSTEQLRSQLGEGRLRDLDPGTVRRYIYDLRRALGEDRVPEAKAGGSYEVVGVDADAVEFARLTGPDKPVGPDNPVASDGTASPARLAGGDGEGEGEGVVVLAGRLAAALSMVRAAPFSDTPKGCYGWADVDPDLSAGMSNGIHRVALSLARLALGVGDRQLAGWAVSKGLLVWPTDEELCVAFLDVAAGDLRRLDAAWTQTVSRLDAFHEHPSCRLEESYRRLRSQM